MVFKSLELTIPSLKLPQSCKPLKRKCLPSRKLGPMEMPPPVLTRADTIIPEGSTMLMASLKSTTWSSAVKDLFSLSQVLLCWTDGSWDSFTSCGSFGCSWELQLSLTSSWSQLRSSLLKQDLTSYLTRTKENMWSSSTRFGMRQLPTCLWWLWVHLHPRSS